MIRLSINEKKVFDNETALALRECQILCRIAVGKTVMEIAEELCRSPKTISSQRVRGLQKLDLRNNEEVVAYFLHKGYTKVEDAGKSESWKIDELLRQGRINTRYPSQIDILFKEVVGA